MSNASIEEVEQLAMQLTPADQLRLVEDLARHLQQNQSRRPPRDLRGDWKGKFPEDFDIDAALREIRSEWEKELEEM